MAKNQRQMTQNVARAQGEGAIVGPSSREQRKSEINRTLATSRASTASMGRFDKVLEGEKKLKGVKRKVHFLLPFAVYGGLMRVYSSSLQRPLLSEKRQQILLSYRRWRRSRVRKRPEKTQETMFSMYAKPFVQPVEERAVLRWPDHPGEAREKSNHDDSLVTQVHRRTNVPLLCNRVRQA